MDLTNELNKRLAGINESSRADRIKAAIRHIHVAERHLESARTRPDPELFNDVVYRTNQAFEGMLKEAYHELVGTVGKDVTPFQIEQYLLNKDRLPDRVLKLFQNYRQSWRNPATHDHTILFKEQEALLAIVSVSAFAVVLLDLVVELESAKQIAEKTRTHGSTSQVISRGRLVNELVQLFLGFRAKDSPGGSSSAPDSAIVGILTGLVCAFDPTIQVHREPAFGKARPDLLFQRDNESVAVELTARDAAGGLRDGSVFQMMTILEKSKLEAGIVFAPPRDAGEISVARVVRFPQSCVYVIAPGLASGEPDENKYLEGFVTDAFSPGAAADGAVGGEQ